MSMDLKQGLAKIAEEINSREPEITDYDMKVGDGDHALNMQRGINAVMENLADVNDSPKDIFMYVGKTIMNVVGGTSGAIYGMAFMAGALALNENLEWNFESLMKMIVSAAQRITKAGGATIGEKTLYDVWGQVERDQKEITNTDILRQKIIVYMNSTKDILATKGRASYMGDRSKGVVDPGAVTSEIIIRWLSKTF